MGLFTRAELTIMRDRTRRRNYSAEAEEFRREHARHREWGLTQRHARKLSRLYGSTANAAAAFQRRADELTAPSCSARAVAPTSPEPIGPKPPASAPTPPEPIGPTANTSEQAKAEQAEQVEQVEQVEPKQTKPEQTEPKQAEPKQAKPEQAKPEQAQSEGVDDAASASGPSGPGNASRRPDHHFHSSRPGRRRPGRPGRHPRPTRKGPHRPDRRESTRHIHPRTARESPKNQARRHPGTTGVKNARQPRRTPLSPCPDRTTSPIPRNCREHIPP
jgi:hypothetical protein